ncbi:transcriptional repressor [Candidatus Saccharibacteria bacterium]|nr:transcriptional repressor [Candidatus Saccharibacteria bacterium]
MIIIINTRKKGKQRMRNSRQSMLVRANIMNRYDHPTAAAVYESVRAESPNISLGTVYRNLDKLARDGEILRISVPGQADRFDATTREHYHLICKKCGEAMDVESRKIVRALGKVFNDDSGFRVDDIQLVAMGKCKGCVKEREKDDRLQQTKGNENGGKPKGGLRWRKPGAK